MVQLLWHICCRPRPGNYELQSSVTLSRSSPQTATKKKIRGGGHILWLSGYHEHTHVHICITTPGRRLFTCQVKGLKSVTDGDLIRKAGPGVENEYAERLQWEGLEQKLKWEWQYSVEVGGFGGGDCRGGSQSYERVKCHKCHVSRPHKDKLCIASEVKAYTDAPVCSETCLNGWSR